VKGRRKNNNPSPTIYTAGQNLQDTHRNLQKTFVAKPQSEYDSLEKSKKEMKQVGNTTKNYEYSKKGNIRVEGRGTKVVPIQEQEMKEAEELEEVTAEIAESEVLGEVTAEIAEAEVLGEVNVEITEAEELEEVTAEIAESEVLGEVNVEITETEELEEVTAEIAEAEVFEEIKAKIKEAERLEGEKAEIKEAEVLEEVNTETEEAEDLEEVTAEIKEAEVLEEVEALKEIIKGKGKYIEYLQSNERSSFTMQKEIQEEMLEELIESATRFTSIPAYLEFVTAAVQNQKEMEALKTNKQQDAISLMSIHNAKGLEFPCVCLLGASDGILPHSSALQEAKDRVTDSLEALEEERRLLYVAITRAKEELYISSPQFFRGKKLDVSRFLFLTRNDVKTSKVKL